MNIGGIRLGNCNKHKNGCLQDMVDTDVAPLAEMELRNEIFIRHPSLQHW